MRKQTKRNPGIQVLQRKLEMLMDFGSIALYLAFNENLFSKTYPDLN